MSQDTSPAAPATDSPAFDNILNFRDVGETINAFLGQKLVREGLFFRAARPDDATPADKRLLRDTYGLRTIIDLRSKTEHINAAKKHQREMAALQPAAVATPDAAFAATLRIPGIRYLDISLTGRSFERHLLRQLSWWSFCKLICLFAVGFRNKAISILGREVMRPRGLPGLATDTLDQSKPEIKQVQSQSQHAPSFVDSSPVLANLYQALSSLIEPDMLPGLVHCTQGKDRTGLTIALVLMVLGVPVKAIDFDYQLSEEALLPEKESRLVEIREIGLPDEYADTAPGFVEHIKAHLDSQYGGLDSYLDSVGFDKDQRQKLREKLSY